MGSCESKSRIEKRDSKANIETESVGQKFQNGNSAIRRNSKGNIVDTFTPKNNLMSSSRLPKVKTMFSPNPKSRQSEAFTPTKIFLENPISQKSPLRKNSSQFGKIDKISKFLEKNPKNYYFQFKNLDENEGSKTFLVTSKITGKKFVMHQYIHNQKNPKFLEEINNNVSKSKLIQHFNTKKYVESFRFMDKIFIINEYSITGYLKNLNFEFTELQAGVIAFQLFQGLKYLNKRKIIHRNIKTENIFLADFLIHDKFPYCKLSDFRFAKEKNEEFLDDIVGTGLFVAPEVIMKKYSEKCDVWSIGVIFYSLIEGKHPFVGETLEEIFSKILDEQLIFSEKFSKETKKFFRKILSKDPQARISSQEALNHIWFKDMGITDIFIPDSNKINEFIKIFNTLCTKLNSELFLAVSSEFKQSKFLFDREIVFKYLDKDNDLKISLNDFIDGTVNMGSGIELQSVYKVFGELGKNRQKTISFIEFVFFTLDKSLLLDNSEVIFNLVKYHYKNVSGDKLSKILDQNVKTSEEIMRKIFYDKKMNFDGNLQLNDFQEILSEILDFLNID